ncbi:hypothetical protein ACQE3E_23510 (plasmid) [Methylomonas sp. MED-D]|uniref:hypothetical protein n=1 Tax=Methylomonas sp. MED-D TaxID=3418768 RepID=UPI003D06C4B0
MQLQKRLAHVIQIIALCLFLSPSVSTAQAPLAAGAEIAGSLAVSDLITQLRNSLISVSDKISSDVSRNSFEVREHIALLIQLIDQLGQSLIGKTFEQLDKEQRAIFLNINNSVVQMQNAASVTLVQVDDIVARTNDAFGTLPGADRNPRVLRYGPAYVVGIAPETKPAAGSDIPVNVSGSWLGIGEPLLAFGGTPCRLQGKTETSLSFNCPLSAFVSGSKVESFSGNLTVFREKTFWEDIKNVFVEVPTRLDYKLAIFTVPQTMGTYKVSAIVATSNTEEVIRQTQDFYHSNGHCEGRANPVWTVNATTGWKIDVNSIQVHENTKNGDSQNHGAFNRTENGFQMGGIVRNEGTCVGPFKDARGWLGVRATYREYRTIDGTANAGPWSGVLEWGKDVPVTLPNNAKSFRVEVMRVDGRLLVDESAPQNRGWHTIEYNPTSRSLTMKVQPVANAL